MKLNKEDARQYILANGKNLLHPDNSRRGFICPICGSGSGSKGTGITTRDGTHFSCWAGCFTHSDIIDIIGQRDGLTDYAAKLEAACREAGIELDEAASSYRGTTARGDNARMKANQNQHGTEQDTHNNMHIQADAQQNKPAPTDYTTYYSVCHKRLEETDYPQKRGLSAAILERFNIGYDSTWKHPKLVAEGKNPPASPRLIIPTSTYSYLARDTRTDVPEQYQGLKKMKVGDVHIFNLQALEDKEQPCFIVEGEIDALSIIEVGGNALALGSVSYTRLFLAALEGRKIERPLLLALDNDAAGNKQTRELETELAKRKIPYYRRNIAGEFKDANERLQRDREGLRAAVEAATNAEDETKEAYLSTSNAGYLQAFIDGIAESVNTPCIRTGFNSLDAALGGGLYEGLAILGGITSLGKTSFALQLCEQVAAAGTDVLIFSLEMARTELIAKSISRQSFILAHKKYPAAKDVMKANALAKDVRGITEGRKYINYSREERALITESVKAYGEYAGRIYIREALGDIGTTDIREAIQQHILLTGNKPLVVVDYLQILKPENERATEKQSTDKAVLDLKRISRDFKLPILVISSFNRMSYKDAADLSAFKESGGIEYGADLLFGLQLKGAGKQGFDANAEKKKNPRTVELTILKNRNGEVGAALEYSYYPRFNHFAEA